MAPENGPAIGQLAGPGNVHLTSEEINILIYLYLLESNFKHTAFTLLSESALPSTALFQQFNPGYPVPPSQRSASNTFGSSRTNGATRGSASETFGAPQDKIARGELIRKLWKALRWEEIERHTTTEPDAFMPACNSRFQLLVPHTCSPEGELSVPGVSSSPPPRRPDTFPWHPGPCCKRGKLLDGASRCSSDGVGRLFTPSGQLQGILSYGRGTINSLKFNPSGNSLLAAKDDFTVCLFLLNFDLQSPKQLSFESHTKEVNDVDWLDDDVFASGGNDHTIFIYRSNDRRPRFTLKGHSDDVTRVKWSPARPGEGDQQRLLASVSDDGSIMIWKLPHYPADRGTVSRSLSPSKQPREKEPSTDEFFQMTVLPGSEYCVNRLQVVNSSTDNKRMNTVEWGPTCKDGRMIIAAGGQDSTVKLFDASSGECLHALAGLEHGTGSIAFSPTSSLTRPGGVLAGGGWNGKAILWDVVTGEVLKEYEVEEELERQSTRDRPMMMTMAWRHDGQQLAVGLHNKSLMTAYVGSLL
ncbi:uncharacterized protein CcaverHIS019_0307850 [Cutaneotrichosporon cavernicola]|uniref:WD40 repeat-like protein n=1 Tax=Cutaneotrichosporon cavernicola TaxID=279322 RepID=A0AA48IA94_9TREE|nr:uncharacterized protein CcaverHIS019_0307850 [Cutaneotrichosporon cavernicola]BEI90715.1 hypothetical protein CcaverHIS019_0307850 [Cutaneotrichosporon cavernicola]